MRIFVIIIDYVFLFCIFGKLIECTKDAWANIFVVETVFCLKISHGKFLNIQACVFSPNHLHLVSFFFQGDQQVGCK